jgi:threonine dehydrogenase-like Zn-dependent dehydrogenase
MAGSSVALQSMLSAARFHARLVITAVYPQPVELDLQTMLLKELSLQMAVGYPTELPEVLSVLAQVSDEEVSPYVSNRFEFSEFQQAIETARQPTSGKVMVYFD